MTIFKNRKENSKLFLKALVKSSSYCLLINRYLSAFHVLEWRQACWVGQAVCMFQGAVLVNMEKLSSQFRALET